MFKETLIKSLSKSLAFFIVGFLFFRVLGPIPLSINQITTNKSSTFDVSGEGKVTTIPDTAEIMLGINVKKPTVQEAQKQANETINNITEAIKKLGVKKEQIKTSQYSVYPDYDYTRGQRIAGYNVSITLDVKAKELDKINEIIDTATSLGANQIGSLSFSVDDEKLEELKSEARKQAIDKAKAKAQEIAKAGGMRLGKIVNISESYGSTYPPYPMRNAAVGAGESLKIDTQVQPGESDITVSVILSYETL